MIPALFSHVDTGYLLAVVVVGVYGPRLLERIVR